MAPNAGYWRTGFESTEIFSCPNSVACIGSDPPPYINYQGNCEKGYTGNKCQGCDEGYSRSSKNVCGECPSKELNSLRIAGIFVLAVIMIIIMVKTSMDSAYKPKALHSVYIKIFMNYL